MVTPAAQFYHFRRSPAAVFKLWFTDVKKAMCFQILNFSMSFLKGILPGMSLGQGQGLPLPMTFLLFYFTKELQITV